MAPKSLPPELLFEFVPFVRAEDAVPNAFSCCRLFHNLLLPRVDKWKEKIKMDRENLEDSKNEIKQLKEKIQKQEEEMERMRKALNEGQSSSAGAGTSSAKFTANEYLRFLRTQKAKGKGRKLQEEIGKECFGPAIAAAMQFNLEREKNEQTCFTPLTEGEACKLADDFRSIIKKHYPSDAIARQIVAGQGYGYTQWELYKFRELLGRVLDIHKSDPNLLSTPSLLPNEIQMGFNAVSELTHGFGRIATETVLQMLDEVLEHCASHSAV